MGGYAVYADEELSDSQGSALVSSQQSRPWAWDAHGPQPLPLRTLLQVLYLRWLVAAINWLKAKSPSSSGVHTACPHAPAYVPCTSAHHTMRSHAPIPAQLFWSGMHMGFLMRQQCIAAIHSKVLRLNSAAIAHVSSGHVVNLVSNDVRRFDDAMPYWMFLWAGGWTRWSPFPVSSFSGFVTWQYSGGCARVVMARTCSVLARPHSPLAPAHAPQWPSPRGGRPLRHRFPTWPLAVLVRLLVLPFAL